MKKNVIITSICILFALLIAFGSVYCYRYLLNKKSDDESTNPKKVLENYERVKMNIGAPLEEELDSFVTDEDIKISDSSRALLEYFEKDLSGTKTVKKIYKKSFDITVTRVITENMEVDFDENGNIESYKNLDNYSTRDKDRRDYNENEPLPVIDYKIDDVSKLQDIISMLEKLSGLDGYKMVDCSNNIQGAWIISWTREYEGELLNSYDNCNVVVDAKDGSVWMYGKNAKLPNRTVPVISEADAIDAASCITSRYEGNVVTSTRLTFTKPNFYFEEGGPYESANFVRLCYAISMDNGIIIYIDAETKEVLGGTNIGIGLHKSR